MSIRKAWLRLSRLSWDEFHTRLGQAVSKRVDVARYRLGMDSHAVALPSPPGQAPAFLVPREKIPHRAELLRCHLPEEVKSILSEADEICRHQFRLLGYEKLDYGSDIDWHLDAVHGKRARLRPWFKIDFLDFSETGDHKVIWELNRHQHLVTLAKAWCLTSDPSYVNELSNQWYGWRKANPYPLGINWASTLEVAFRSLSWLWVENLLAGCQELPSNFDHHLVVALRENGRYIEKYLSKYFSPNTHLLGEAVALFYIGTLHPEMPEAKRWQKLGWDTVIEESGRQVLSDGVYFEQALYYHVYALDFFLYARMLAVRNGIRIPSQFDQVLEKMLDVLNTLCRGGAIEGFGDDDGGRVFNPRRNRVEHMPDPLILGAVEYHHPEWAATAKLTEESVWLCGESALAVTEAQLGTAKQVSRAFEAGGIYLMWDEDPAAQQMMIDAGSQGVGNSGHGHADALSIRFSLDGQRYLVDPGTCRYISEGNERAEFRGTGAHNTLRVDSVDQAIPAGPFAWTSLPEVRAEQWRTGETFDLFEGSHNGYCRLKDPVLHRRFVFHVKGAFWLIRDIVEGKQTHLLETFWHFGSELHVREHQGALIASLPEPCSHGNSVARGLALLQAQAAAWQTEVISGEVSPAFGAKQSAPVVRVSATAHLPTESAVLLVPLASGSAIGRFTEHGSGAVGVHAYHYGTGQIAHHIFFSDRPGAWSCGAWSSDAHLLYCRLEEGRLTQIILVSGTFGKWQDKTLVSHRAQVEQFELIKVQGRFKAVSSQPAILEQVVDGAFELLDPLH